MDGLDGPATGIEDHQRQGDDDGADVQLLPLGSEDAANDQRHEAQHDAGDYVAGQHDEDGTQHAGEGIDRIAEVQLGDVAQHQKTDVHQGRCGGVSGVVNGMVAPTQNGI